MRIALLVTGPAGIRGGAEEHFDGLEAGIRGAGHEVDRVHVPCDESRIQGILEGYEAARELDVSRYDAVLSTKAPTYVVRHPRHVLHLIHTIRVFYDMFDSWTDGHPDRWFERDLIRELDYEALSAIPEHRRFTNGEEVARRLFDSLGLRAVPVYPALRDSGRFRQGSFEHFLFASRLHPWKRADLVVQAYRRTKTDVPLLIAGSGPEESRLRELAGEDPRIRFVGHVSRTDLISLYADARAVLFAPVREDFGYVTLEAMLSGKPIITAFDSGEVARFVSETGAGLVVDAEPGALASGIDRLGENAEEARRIGAKGLERARGINWPDAVDTLLRSLDSPARTSVSCEKPKIRLLVADSQPIEPPVGGGRIRLWGLYSHLPGDIDARYVGTYDWPGPAYRALRHDGNLLEVTVPQSADHFRAHRDLLQREPKLTVDVTFPRLSHLSSGFVRRVRDEAAQADVVVLSHPWVYPHLVGRPELAGKPLIYDAQNVEGLLKRTMLGHTGIAHEIASEIELLEGRLCQDADAILACSDQDAYLFRYFYGVAAEKLRVVPNGVDTSQVRPADGASRAAARARLGLALDCTAAVFIGSDYGPNAEAARFICRDLAPRHADLQFVIVGGCGDRVSMPVLPRNVRLLGRVDEKTRMASYAAADIALNPVTLGGGTSIKMLDYLSSGLPVVSTVVGARGFEPDESRGLLVVPLGSFSQALAALAAEAPRRERMAQAARKYADERFDWRRIGECVGRTVRDQLALRSRALPPSPSPPSARTETFRLAVLSPWDTRCGIADHTRSLIEALPPSVDWRVYADTDTGSSSTPPRLRRNWSRGLPSLVPLEASLLEDRPHALLVQYQPSFFDAVALESLLRLARQEQIRTAVILHSLGSIIDDDALRREGEQATALFVHKAADVEKLRSAGLGGPAELLPHGCLPCPDTDPGSIRRDLGLPEGFLVSTFGFARPHKGVYELVEAFEQLAQSDPSIGLLVLAAEYPSPDSRVYRSVCERRIRASAYASRIHAHFDHLPMEQVRLLLQASDLVVLPYGFSRESTSGAARLALSIGRPLLTSPSPVFDDLRGVAEQLRGTEPASIAAAISELRQDPARLSRCAQRVRSCRGRSSWHHTAVALTARIRSAPAPACPPRPRISVIVPTYERQDRLPGLLGRLEHQTFRDFEVILVDQSALPWTPAESFRDPRLRYFHSTVRGAIRARNRGACEARGSILAFTDDDCLPESTWLANAGPYFDDLRVVGVEGFIRSERRDDPDYRAVTNENFEGIGFMTANLLVRREVFFRAGGFDLQLRRPAFPGGYGLRLARSLLRGDPLRPRRLCLPSAPPPPDRAGIARDPESLFREGCPPHAEASRPVLSAVPDGGPLCSDSGLLGELHQGTEEIRCPPRRTPPGFRSFGLPPAPSVASASGIVRRKACGAPRAPVEGAPREASARGAAPGLTSER